MLAVLLILVREKIIWLLKEIPLLALFIVLRIGGNLQNVRHIYNRPIQCIFHLGLESEHEISAV